MSFNNNVDMKENEFDKKNTLLGVRELHTTKTY